MAARAALGSPPVTRSRGRLAYLLPLPVAATTGLATGLAPSVALVVLAAAVSTGVLVFRLEWAALAVIGTAVFEGYLAMISPWATQWLAGVLVVAWLVRRWRGRLHHRRLRTAVLPGGLLLLVIGLAHATQPPDRAGLTVSATYAGLVVVSWVLADCLCGPLAPRRAARLYVLSCVLASCCGLVTFVLDDRHQVTGPVAGPDVLAFFLVAAVPLVGTVRTRDRQPVWWVWASFALLMVAGVGTRSGAASAALVVMVVVAAATGLLSLRHAGALLGVVLAGVALMLAVVPLSVGHAITDPQRYADTDPLAQAAAELGVLGVIALYAVWLVPAAAARRRWLRDRSQLTSATLLALVGLLTASLLVPGQPLLPLWFLTAMTVALGRRDRPGPIGSEGL